MRRTQSPRFLQREGRNDGTLVEWSRDVDVSSPFILVEKIVAKLGSSVGVIQG